MIDAPGRAVVRPAPDALVREVHRGAQRLSGAGRCPPLAPCASDPRRSRGRRIAEPPAPTRNDYQRDRDRIVHSTAFRRLVYKTQVFLNHEGDLFRTRLTHSLEVAQLGRSIARALRLERRPGRGHRAGARPGPHALRPCRAGRAARLHARRIGGFEHNLQSLRVVDQLEERYPRLRRPEPELRDARRHPQALLARARRALERAEPGGVARRFLDGTQPSLEAQLCNLADEIAYNAHDIDDGVRSGLLSSSNCWTCRCSGASTTRRWPSTRRWPQPAGGCCSRRIRRMLSAQVHDVIDATRRRCCAQHAPADADAVRAGAAAGAPSARRCAEAAPS